MIVRVRGGPAKLRQSIHSTSGRKSNQNPNSPSTSSRNCVKRSNALPLCVVGPCRVTPQKCSHTRRAREWALPRRPIAQPSKVQKKCTYVKHVWASPRRPLAHPTHTFSNWEAGLNEKSICTYVAHVWVSALIHPHACVATCLLTAPIHNTQRECYFELSLAA